MEKNINTQIKETLSLENVINIIKKYRINTKNKTDINNLIEDLVIKSYLPLLNKTTAIMSIIMSNNYSDTEYEELKIAEMYKTIFFTIILGQYTNIDVSDSKLFTYDNYDLLYPIIGDYILTYCGKDFELFMEMLKNTISFYNIKELS